MHSKHLNELQKEFKLCRIEINPNKSAHTILSIHPYLCPPSHITANNDMIPSKIVICHLVFHLDSKLIKTKKKCLNKKTPQT